MLKEVRKYIYFSIPHHYEKIAKIVGPLIVQTHLFLSLNAEGSNISTNFESVAVITQIQFRNILLIKPSILFNFIVVNFN